MIKHLLISTFRSLKRRTTFTLINVVGLSISMLAALSILSHVAYERSFDRFHGDMSEVYRLNISYTNVAGEFGVYAGISNEISEQLVNEFPEVVSSTRIFPILSALRHSIFSYESDEQSVEFNISNAWAVDPEAFDIFKFVPIHGTKDSFQKTKEGIAISASTAQRYFGNQDPIGQVIKLNGSFEYKVVIVFEDWPESSHLHPEVLVQLDHIESNGLIIGHKHFLSDSYYTYLVLSADADLNAIDAKLDGFVARNKRPQDFEDVRIELMPFNDVHLKASHVRQDMAEKSNASTINLLVILAVLILSIAWFNYINLTTSTALQRSREIAVRRIHGASRHFIFWQLLTETAIITVFALILALTLGQYATSFISDIVGAGEIAHLLSNIILTGGALTFLIVSVLLSAAYPTLILGSFKNPELIKGNLKGSRGASFWKKFFVVSQYAITIGLVFGTFTVIKQIRYLKSIETNLTLDQVMVVNGPGVQTDFDSFRDGMSAFKNELMNIPGVESVATSNYVPGLKVEYTALLSNPQLHGDKPNYVRRIFADDAFLNTYSIDMVAGRYFGQEHMTMDVDYRPIVINESAARSLGFESAEKAINKKLRYWSDPIEVIGVVEDFLMESPDVPIEPLFLFPTFDTKYFSIRMTGDISASTIKEIEQQWNEIYPGNPYEFFFAKAHYDRQYASFSQFESQLSLSALLSIIVASLGLFALAHDASRQRIKEVGIRKVLGASAYRIISLFLNKYTGLIFISALIAVPGVFVLTSEWLNAYANRINISWELLILPAVGTMLLAALVITIQTLKVARMNPVESLRYE